MSSNCANCNSPISHDQHFCPNCGQKAHLHRLSWHDVTHDAIHYFTHADKGIFHLLVQLATKSGTVAREFVQGKRKKYFPPFNFFLIVATIYVFVFTLNDKPQATADVLKEHPELSKIPNEAKRANVVRIYERGAKARSFMSKHSNNVAMLALPLIALIYWLFYRRAGYNYIEHLVANMYMSGFALLIQVVFFVPLSSLFEAKNSPVSLMFFFVFQLIYFSFFYYYFVNSTKKGSGVKAFFISLFVIVFWGALSFGIIRLYITNGFWGILK